MGGADNLSRAGLGASSTWLLLVSLVVAASVAEASLQGSFEQQQNAACSYVLGRARTAPQQHSKQSACNSTVKCLINELGWPNTGAEL